MFKKISIGLIAGAFLIIIAAAVTSDNGSSETSLDSRGDTVVNTSTDMAQIPSDLEGNIKSALSKQSDDDVVILDVRTQSEWDEMHVAGATLFDNQRIQAGELPSIDKDAEIYIYCRSGNRAAEAIAVMQQAGFTNMTNLRGLSDWIQAGAPTESEIF